MCLETEYKWFCLYLECLWVQQVRNDNTIVVVDAGTTPMTYTEGGAKDPSKKRTKKHVQSMCKCDCNYYQFYLSISIY